MGIHKILDKNADLRLDFNSWRLNNFEAIEAAVNLSKQAHLLKNNIPDPLASICA